MEEEQTSSVSKSSNIGENENLGGPSSTPSNSTSAVQPPTTVECPPPIPAASTGDETIKGCSKKRKQPENTKLEVWDHFIKLPLDDTDGELRAKCKYCTKDYACDAVKCGTTSLKRHFKKCPNNPHRAIEISKQSMLNYVSQSGEGGIGSLAPHMFNQKCCRRALAEFIICDEMPFRLVEKKGFKSFVKELEPRFHIPSRQIVARNCWQLYLSEMHILKNQLKQCM